jgi:SWI/SNF-related matrix-associated actin-dependent regulator of chromatin subfamily A3
MSLGSSDLTHIIGGYWKSSNWQVQSVIHSTCPFSANQIDLRGSIGQKRPVHVYQLIAENTVESKVRSLNWVPHLSNHSHFSSGHWDTREKEASHSRGKCWCPLSIALHWLHAQAFSGIKRTETQRQKKEARLQGKCLWFLITQRSKRVLDLIELFGIRQHQA